MNLSSEFDHGEIETMVRQLKSMPGAMLPILHAVQDKLGYIPADVIPIVASELNLSRAEVHGVVTYYHFFRQHKAGTHTVQICRAEACQANGGNALAEHAKAALGCDFHATSADGEFTLEPVYCLGQCGCAPAMMLGPDLYARVTPEKFNRLVAAKRGTL